MIVKNVSSRRETFFIRIEGVRTMHEVLPGETAEVPRVEGINLCKRSSAFVPFDKESQDEYDKTVPKLEPVTKLRERTGSEKMAEKDIKRGKKYEGGEVGGSE